MENDPLDEIVARIPIGDPSGQSVSFSGRVLCQNVLTTGMVGSGKTTSVIYPILKDLIAYRASEPDRKLGLFVFDSKCDGTTERVFDWAERSGRKDDVVVLRPGSKWGYCPIPTEGLLSQMEVVAAKLLAGFRDSNEDHEYWDQTMRTGVEAALAMDMLEHGSLEFNRTLATLSQVLLAPIGDSPARRRVDAFATKCDTAIPHIDANCARIIDGYCRALKTWVNLDSRTGGILQSCVGNALRPLLSPRMLDYYPMEGRKPFQVDKIVTEGKILILRTNAAADEDLAATLGRLIKSDLYRSLQNRSVAPGAAVRLVGLIFDEYPLVATANEPYFGDVQNLQTLREKRGFVVAGTQGYISMNNSIGASAWEGLRINFGSCVFMKSNEPEVEMHARNILGRMDGETSVRMRVESTDSAMGGWTSPSESKSKVSVEGETFIIGEGALARLEAHEGYYIISDGEISESPVFLVPVFETPKPSGVVPGRNLLDYSAAIFRHTSSTSSAIFGSDFSGRPLLPGTCSENASGAPLPLPMGAGSFFDVMLLAQEFAEAMTDNAVNAKPTIKERSYGIQNRGFADLLHLLCKEPKLARLAVETFHRAGEAVLAFSETFQKISCGRKVSRSKLAAEVRALYQALGLTTTVDTHGRQPANLTNRDSKAICSSATELELTGLPDEIFRKDSVCFLSVLNDPFYKRMLPRLLLVTTHEGLPLAVFDPGAVTRDNAILVATALVSFRGCFLYNPPCLSVSA